MTIRFLETITFIGSNALIPIDNIKSVIQTYNDGWRIIIKTYDDNTWEECFDKNNDKCEIRYIMIKAIIGAM